MWIDVGRPSLTVGSVVPYAWVPDYGKAEKEQSRKQACSLCSSLWMWLAALSSCCLDFPQWWTLTWKCELEYSLSPENLFLRVSLPQQSETKAGSVTSISPGTVNRLHVHVPTLVDLNSYLKELVRQILWPSFGLSRKESSDQSVRSAVNKTQKRAVVLFSVSAYTGVGVGAFIYKWRT